MPADLCKRCGHDRVFHSIGTGNGVPIGKAYCSDRHGDDAAYNCKCTGFVAGKLIFEVIEDLKQPAAEKTHGRDFGDEDVPETAAQVLTQRIDSAVEDVIAALKPFTPAGRAHVLAIVLSKYE